MTYSPSLLLGLNIHVQRPPSGQLEFHTQVSSLTLAIPTAWGSWATGQVLLEKWKLGDNEKPISSETRAGKQRLWALHGPGSLPCYSGADHEGHKKQCS